MTVVAPGREERVSVVTREVSRAELADRPPEPVEPRRTRSQRRGWLVRRLLLGADLAGLSLAFLLAGTFGETEAGGVRAPWEVLVFFSATLPAWVLAAQVTGLYDRDEKRASHTTADDLAGVFQLVTLGAWILVAAAWAFGLRPDLGRIVAFWGGAIALVTLLRTGARAVCRRLPAYRQNAVVVGAGEVGQLAARKLLQHPEYGINVLGFVDRDPPLERGSLELPLLGPPERLPSLVRRLDLERVFVAFSRDSHEPTLALVRSLRELDVQVDVVPRFFEIVGPGAEIHSVEGLALVGLPPIRLSPSCRLLKRAVDLALSTAALLVLSPLLALVALAVKLDSPGPVLFTQDRMGAGDRTFRIRKFRTMTAGADAQRAELRRLSVHAASDPRLFKIRDDPRVTRVGRLLRRASLDELPQLWNVLKGEMSLVGPRPLPLEEDSHVTGWARRRLDLKPGITGLWQVLGRSEIPFEEMVRLDYLYVASWSLTRDCQLLLRTVPVILGRGRGAF